MPSELPSYSPDQIDRYLQRIGHNGNFADTHQSAQNDPLNTLTKLQRLHLCAIPWGNSSLHYSQHHSVSIHPEAIFEKLVIRRLDGYCLESTNLFYGILRTLGYQVYPTAGRVNVQAAFGKVSYQQLYVPLLLGTGLVARLTKNHFLLIVTIEGEKYMVDVGYGSNCATRPLVLKENLVEPHITPAETRLIRDTLPEFTNKAQRVWIYQVRYTPESDWMPNICFSETEFLAQDFTLMNFFTSKHPSSWFAQMFVCSLMIMGEDGEEIQGQYTMFGKEVKRRIHGKTEVLKTMESEEDRVQALAKWFGICLREDEAQGILGLMSQIK